MKIQLTQKYPSQDEAQLMIDWLNALDTCWLSSCEIGDEYQKAFEKADDIRKALWEKTFGDMSPWRATIKRTRNTKKFVYVWDKEKAERLKI